MSMPERSCSVEQKLIVIYICLMIKTAQFSFQLHFLALFPPLAESCGSGRPRQSGSAVESTFCDGRAGGQEDTLCPGLGLPRGHLDRRNTHRVPGQTRSSTLTHAIPEAHTLKRQRNSRFARIRRLLENVYRIYSPSACAHVTPRRMCAYYMYNQEYISRRYPG